MFETSLDDYAEIWVDGELPRYLGQEGGSVISGWNAPNRLVIGRNIKPGQRDHLSEEDIARVNTLYPAFSSASSLASAEPCVRTITTSTKVGDRTTTTTIKTEPCSPRFQKTITEPSFRRPCCWDGEARRPFCRRTACPAVGVRWPRPDGWCRPRWCRPWPRPHCDGWVEARWERPPFDGWDGRW